MSELKTYFLGKNNGREFPVYLKSEADKVIAEKDTKIKRLEKCEQWMKDHFFCEEIAVVKERHQKYKRCLAMAKWCAAECVVNQDTYRRYSTHKSEFRIGHLRKWHKRWLALAEKFKEAK